MRRITIDLWKHISSNTEVPSGFSYTLTSPAEPGFYTLYELVDEHNAHKGWEWEKEKLDPEGN